MKAWLPMRERNQFVPWSIENKQLWYVKKNKQKKHWCWCSVSARRHAPDSGFVNPRKLPPPDTHVLSCSANLSRAFRPWWSLSARSSLSWLTSCCHLSFHALQASGVILSSVCVDAPVKREDLLIAVLHLSLVTLSLQFSSGDYSCIITFR